MSPTVHRQVSLCLVVANSEDCLPRWFAWALPRFAELVIVRSHSDDGTDAILDAVAARHPGQVRLFDRTIDTIAAQKQYCVSRATRRWRLVVDADEVMEDVHWDGIATTLDQQGADLLQMPRYNLQRDDQHYLPAAYPDRQERLFRSHVRFSDAPRHQTHHQMVGARRRVATSAPHVLHWGHIRSTDQLAWKSRVRRRWAATDYIEGDGLTTHDNWFHHRNDALDAEAAPLPAPVAAYIRHLDALARDWTP